MARGTNLVLQGLSGKLGETLVIRRVGNQTVLCKAPDKRTKEPSEQQLAHQRRFTEASIYARSVIQDETAKAEYTARIRPGRKAYQAAMADFFYAPTIEDVDLSQYQGTVGDTIRAPLMQNL